MCGLIGIVSKDKCNYIAAANKVLSHRGPDDEGLFQSDNISLGHQRLAIIDLSPLGHQPMTIDDQSLVMVYNGEIYNYKEIRKDLEKKYRFRSSSDSETILYGYKEYGTELFKKLNGIFALVIYDKIKNQLIVCRDQFGVKPLYYYRKGEEIYITSEIKSFLKIPGWDKSIDYSALLDYLHFLWSPGTKTPFKFVRKLLPGHFMVIDCNKPQDIKFEQYYEIPFNGDREKMPEEKWVNELDNAFSKAVERQLLSDVPVGFFLSGGLDSSLIVAKARQLTGKRINCYTIDTDLNSNDKEGFTNDLAYAKKVAKDLDVDLHIVSGQIDILKDFDKMIWHLDEPQADAAPLNVLNISREARQNGDVVLLGGAGGDDLFSGYRRHQALNFEGIFNKIPPFFAKGLRNSVSILPSSNATFRRLKKLVKDIDKSEIDRLAGYYEWLPLSINKSLFTKESIANYKDYDPSNYLKKSLSSIPHEQENLNKLLYWDLKFFLTDHNLNYTDKLSMAEGVETRVPFLDIDLVNLSTRIPVHLKMKNRETKYLLKKCAEKYLPKDVIYRPKTGFGAPVRKWITNDLDDLIGDYLSANSIRNRGIFNPAAVQNLVEENKSGRIDASYSIWALLAIESWMRQFADQ